MGSVKHAAHMQNVLVTRGAFWGVVYVDFTFDMEQATW